MSEKTRADANSLKFEEGATAALVGVSTVVVVQLLQVNTFDLPLKIALYCFAVSIPMLTALLIIIWAKADYSSPVSVWSEAAAGTLGIISSIVGLGAIFWHFSQRIGITFIIASTMAFLLVRIWARKNNRISREIRDVKITFHE